MIVYCRNRSIALPRKSRKPRAVPKNGEYALRSSPHLGPSHKDKPSVFERRCLTGVWVDRDRDWDEQEAARILGEML